MLFFCNFSLEFGIKSRTMSHSDTLLLSQPLSHSTASPMAEHQQAYRTYSPRAVANCFLSIAEDEGSSITNLRLQKLIYFAHGIYLATTGAPLVNEPFQAWTYGPVLPSLYALLRVFGNKPISYDIVYNGEDVDRTSQAYAIIKMAWDRLKVYTTAQLVEVSHRMGSPWHNAIAKGGRFTEISNDDLRTYFSR